MITKGQQTQVGRFHSRMLCFQSSAWLVVSMIWLVSCAKSDENLLQSPCVIDYFELERTRGDGASCSNFSYGDCAEGARGSECVNVCVFGVCQATPCFSDADCGGALCREKSSDSVPMGSWCDFDQKAPGASDDNGCGACGVMGTSGACCGTPFCSGACSGSACCD